MVETVGVGQDEVEIARLADVTLVVLVPGMGDDVQAIKAGIMEIADVFVINKSDLPGAEKLERELNSYLGLSHRPDGWTPRSCMTVASEGKGIEEAAGGGARVSRPGVEPDARGRNLGDAAAGNAAGTAARPVSRGRICRCGARSSRVTSRSIFDTSMTGLNEFKIDHLGIAVRSLDQALEFYRDQLGLSVSLRETVAHEKVNVAMLPLGEPRIELLEPSEADSVIGKFLDKRGEGLHHVALRSRI